ncbi:MAG TPA: ABC transporter substrate-binding protein, partial [Acidimicrobiales bacterium]|nr:ABC transporter substrate-binding protein [Acidimicrobiales bacterium]
DWMGRAGLGAAAVVAGPGLLGSCAYGDDDEPATAGDELRIGVVAPFSGVGAFLGDIVDRSLDAAVRQVNGTGGVGGRKVALVKRDTGIDPSAGPRVYADLAGKGVAGILWCGAVGFSQVLPQVKRDQMPLVAVFNDPWSAGQLHPDGDGAGRSVFQVLLPDAFAKRALAEYAAGDRGYRTAAYLYDSLLDPGATARRRFEREFTAAGIEVTGVETFTLLDSDFGPQLQRLRERRPEVLYVDGVNTATAGVVAQLADLGASYVDTPTAKGPAWHPHVFGSPAGAGDRSWVELAGAKARVGTATAWHVGGLVYLPSYAIGGWMRRHLGREPTGGEEAAPDALAAVLAGIRKAGSTDHALVVEGMETAGPITFASLEFSFSRDRHLARTVDDVVIVVMERGGDGPAATDPPYALGREWSRGQVFGGVAAGPTQLVRPTLAANRRAHPGVMDQVVAEGYGTHCTRRDGALTPDCRIH